MKIGVIADDFTGATDIASFLVLNGLKTVQMCGVTPDTPAPDAEAVVISHKSRSCPVADAIAETQASLQWLLQHGAQQIYFKYCSTFDSSKDGNIGPMRNHPITPMTDSSLVRLVEMQSKGKCGVVTLETIRQGAQAVKAKIEELKAQGYSYAVLDAVDESDLVVQGEALKDMRLVTGGSGLAIGLARQVAEPNSDSKQAQSLGYPQGKQAVVFSGSCSVMTNKQVAFYQQQAATKVVDVDKLMATNDLKAFVKEYVTFYQEHAQGRELLCSIKQGSLSVRRPSLHHRRW